MELGVKYRFIEEDDKGWRHRSPSFLRSKFRSRRRQRFFQPKRGYLLAGLAQKDLDSHWTINAGRLLITPR